MIQQWVWKVTGDLSAFTLGLIIGAALKWILM